MLQLKQIAFYGGGLNLEYNNTIFGRKYIIKYVQDRAFMILYHVTLCLGVK